MLLTEYKADLAAFLKAPAPIPVRNLADVIAFKQCSRAPGDDAVREETFIKAQATKGPTIAPTKRRAGQLSRRRTERDRRMLKEHRLDALVGPTMPGVENRRGQRRPDRGRRSSGWRPSRLSAPHRAEGHGQGIAGRIELHRPKWSEARMLSWAMPMSRRAGRCPDQFYRSIEESPEMRRI